MAHASSDNVLLPDPNFGRENKAEDTQFYLFIYSFTYLLNLVS